MKHFFIFISIAVTFGCFYTTTAALAMKTTVVFHEEEGIERKNEPVTFGVPLTQKANILTTNNFGVFDGTGTEIPAQFTVTARWGGTADNTKLPIRWVLVDTQVNVSGNNIATYTISSKKGRGNATGATTGLFLTEDANYYTIQTGATTFRLRKDKFNGFDQVITADNQKIIDSSLQDGLKIVDKNNNTHYASEINFSDIAPATVTEDFDSNTNGQKKYSYNNYRFGSSVEREGAMRIRLRYHGKFAGSFSDESVSGNSDEANLTNYSWQYKENEVSGDDEIEYTVLLDFYAGTGFVRAYVTFENNNSCLIGDTTWTCQGQGSYNSVTVEDFSWLVTPNLKDQALSYKVFGEDQAYQGALNNNENINLYQDSSGGKNWDYYQNLAPRLGAYSKNKAYTLKKDSTVLSTGGTRALGWLDLNDGTNGVVIGVRDFWQNFPKAVSATNDSDNSATVRLGLMPAEFGALHTLRAGEHDTQEVFFYFHNPGQPSANTIATSFNNPLIPVLPAKYYQKTKALGYLQPFSGQTENTGSDFDQWTAYDAYNAASIDTKVSSYYQTTGGDINSILTNIENYDFYGYATYGYHPSDYEARTGTDNHKYDFNNGQLVQFARTALRDFTYGKIWWNMARTANEAMVDSCVLHEPHALQHLWRGGCVQHIFHDQPQIDQFLRQLGAPSPVVAGGIAGWSNYYFMTDYQKAKEAAIEYANQLLWRWDNRNGDGSFLQTLPERELANGLRIFVDTYQLTGEEKYYTAAKEIVTGNELSGREGYYLHCKNPGACTDAEFSAMYESLGVSEGDYDQVRSPITFWKEMMMESLGLFLEVSTVRDEQNSAAHQAAFTALSDRADFFTNYILKTKTKQQMIDEVAGGSAEINFLQNDGLKNYTFVPYHYALNGSGDNVDGNDFQNDETNLSNFHFFGVDGLAYAYKYTNRQQYLDTATAWYQTLARYPFSLGWDNRRYAQIKEAGKWAEYGRTYLGILTEKTAITQKNKKYFLRILPHHKGVVAIYEKGTKKKIAQFRVFKRKIQASLYASKNNWYVVAMPLKKSKQLRVFSLHGKLLHKIRLNKKKKTHRILVTNVVKNNSAKELVVARKFKKAIVLFKFFVLDDQAHVQKILQTTKYLKKAKPLSKLKLGAILK
ncbi:MAG: hypothetical protein A2233_04855 [Candidatus Kerfeldbacteria bacterium RIFOXYA2_FULL_38_24]|uniref:PcRGLX/YetA-like central beta-sandwich domain-containing protein n=1 Tax=Candidatus Kerfeldbacteria bacterium RIFOXYB2_FULL_38_14 TaxID=1798547 RepID=A0A1G2BIH3_9BACT|nr:MAG: hypothetical protein A2319_02225 [Candidatus Kerfeldbacteria bacterium RIFOXYB2_FULL_38_14]OGY88200.1 MAG: hypothetical protein A2233_04855 [Candidatus Kerfeldbacteria bacterium RIFOXYA2_FULL_38_24]OGY89220.1 MAG: hypothetical protein A2458_01330 [Candidatus Kerfeldbacteria bacterium RIFOXYC2_FULL_38_9]